MKSRYETVFILTPVLSEDQAKEAVTKYKDHVKSAGGKIQHQENWGLKKLAYPIQKKSTGFYNLLEFDIAPNEIDKMETEFRRDERILRFLTVKMEHHHIEFAEKRRKHNSDKMPPKKEVKPVEEKA